MKPLIQFKTTIPLLISLLFVCFGLSPTARAVTPEVVPAPDGFYPGFNTAEGQFSLFSLTTGQANTAVGFGALKFMGSGSNNTAVGVNAMLFDTNGIQNTACGQGTLQKNNANAGTAIGFQALGSNTTGAGNVAVGFQALLASVQPGINTFGGNVAIGFRAMAATTGSAISGDSNTAVGDRAMLSNISGFENSAFGRFSLSAVTSGVDNTAVGHGAGGGITTGSGIVCIGAGQNSDNISGRTFIDNIGQTAQAPSAGTIEFVTVNLSNNKLGHNASSRRYKEDIKPMDKSSELLYQLKPVTFRFKKNAEIPNPSLDYGLIAEDVAEVDPGLAVQDGKGQIESVRYLAIYNMMLNEFLKEHKKVQGLEATVAQQQKSMEVLTAQIKEQAAQIQKVSAQVGMSKPAPKVVANQQ